MPFNARVSKNVFHQIFSPPDFTIQVAGTLPLLTETDAIIQTESSQDIFVEYSTTVQALTARRVGFNIFRVTGLEST